METREFKPQLLKEVDPKIRGKDEKKIGWKLEELKTEDCCGAEVK